MDEIIKKNTKCRKKLFLSNQCQLKENKNPNIAYKYYKYYTIYYLVQAGE